MYQADQVVTSTVVRIGKCGLKSHVSAIRAEDLDRCECGRKETVTQVWLNCRPRKAQRQDLRAALRDRSRQGDMSYLLEGYSGRTYTMGKYIDVEAYNR